MTTNQIAYFKAKIEEQHYNNLDKETQRHNLQTEDVSVAQLSETQRANLVKESQTNRSLTETELRDREQATQTWADLDRKLQEAQVNARLTNAKTEGQRIQNALNAKYGEIDRVFGDEGIAGTIGTVIKVVDYVGSQGFNLEDYLTDGGLTDGYSKGKKSNDSWNTFSNGTVKTASNSYSVAKSTNNLSDFYKKQYGHA